MSPGGPGGPGGRGPEPLRDDIFHIVAFSNYSFSSLRRVKIFNVFASDHRFPRLMPERIKNSEPKPNAARAVDWG